MKKYTKRLGLLLPASNSTMEKELVRYLPAGISLHVERMHVGPVTPDELLAMSKEAPEKSKLLSECKPDALLYGCTSGSFILGKGFDRKLEADIMAVTNIQTITASHAVLNLFEKKDIKKIVVGTPYCEEVNNRLIPFLQDNGLTLLNMKGLGHEDNLAIGNLSPWDAVELAKSIDCAEADAIFLCCTNMQTLAALPYMWELFKKPVISSNYASLVGAVELLGYRGNDWLGMDTGEQLLRRDL